MIWLLIFQLLLHLGYSFLSARPLASQSYIPNAEAIEILKAISKNIQIFYFEGNHDFQLKKIFKNINIYTIGEQPQYMEFNNRRVGLSHGDRFAVGLGHNMLNNILRNSLVLATISFFEEVIITNKTKQLKTKNICNNIEYFEQKTKDISANYKDVDFIIEGHYHQAKIIGKYVSLPSLACQKQVAIARNGEIVFVDIDNL